MWLLNQGSLKDCVFVVEIRIKLISNQPHREGAPTGSKTSAQQCFIENDQISLLTLVYVRNCLDQNLTKDLITITVHNHTIITPFIFNIQH